MITSIFILAILGFAICLYLYFVEEKIKKNPNFKAACDISDKISCTKAVTTGYANLFSVSNALVGMLYYILLAVLAFVTATKLLLVAAIGGVIVSCILGYILYFKVKTLCIMCTSTYIINFIILFIAWKLNS